MFEFFFRVEFRENHHLNLHDVYQVENSALHDSKSKKKTPKINR